MKLHEDYNQLKGSRKNSNRVGERRSRFGKW